MDRRRNLRSSLGSHGKPHLRLQPPLDLRFQFEAGFHPVLWEEQIGLSGVLRGGLSFTRYGKSDSVQCVDRVPEWPLLRGRCLRLPKGFREGGVARRFVVPKKRVDTVENMDQSGPG